MAVKRHLEACLLISPGEVHDITCADEPLEGLAKCAVVTDKGCDGDRVHAHIRAQSAVLNTPKRSNRNTKYRWKEAIYRQRNHVERLFNELKQFRRIATLSMRLHFHENAVRGGGKNVD